MAKVLFKRCPSCRFDRCWAQAVVCEKCGFDFRLGRKPRKAKVEVDEDDDFVPPPPKPPKNTHKLCPECKHRCWHEAHVCEQCEYNFRTGQTKAQRQAAERAAAKRRGDEVLPLVEAKPEVKEMRGHLGYCPVWTEILATAEGQALRAKLDTFTPGDDHALRAWVSQFLLEMRSLFLGHTIYPGCVVGYADGVTRNPDLHAARWKLHEWYGQKAGISTWRRSTDPRLWIGEVFTNAETAEASRAIDQSCREKVAVECQCKGYDGKSFTYLSMMYPEHAETYRAEQAKEGKRYALFTFAQGRSLRLLPKKWDRMSRTEQSAWCAQFVGQPEAGLLGEEESPKPKKAKAKVS